MRFSLEKWSRVLCPCSAAVCWAGAGVGEGQAVAGIWLFTGAACEVLGDCRRLGVGGCSVGELAETAEADREYPRTADGWPGCLSWPERRWAVIAATVFAKGFGKSTCGQISALIIFFKIKGIIFVL